MGSALRSSVAWICFLLTAAAGVSLDLYTKWLAFSTLAAQIVRTPDGLVRVYSKAPYPLIPGWIEFEVTANQGAVFGMGQGRRVLFVVVSFLAIGFLFYLFAHSGKKRFYQILLGMLMAGVVGNLYDRIELGYVRDMIHALSRWPDLFRYIFNVADSLLCVGVSLMILLSLFPEKKAEGAESAGGSPSRATG
jgi:signal peptidase II